MAEAAVEAAPGDENDDSWLYGDATEQSSDKPPEEGAKAAETETATAAPVRFITTQIKTIPLYDP